MMLPFNLFYLCTDDQAVADISESIDVLLELPLKPYVDKIIKSLSIDRSFEGEAELGSLIEENSEVGLILIPMRTKAGKLLHTQAYRPKSKYLKINKYWRNSATRAMYSRMYPTSYNSDSAEDMQVYESRLSLIVKGQRKGNPCSHCPLVLDSLGPEPECTFVVAKCKDNLDLKELLSGS